MKRFLIFSIVFLLIAIFLLPITLRGLKYNFFGIETILSITKSKKKKQVKVLVIGDSVANQLFNNRECNDTIYSLACSQGISFVGYYLLLKNFLENNLPNKVLVIFNPYNLNNNLDEIFTYQYFLKPFYKQEYYKEFTETTWQQIKKQPLYFLSQIPYIAYSNVKPQYTPELKEKYLSTINKDYMGKMIRLLESKNIAYKFISPPLSVNFKEYVDGFKREELDGSGMTKKQIEQYFNNIVFLPDSCFLDNVHFKNPILYKKYIPITFL
ncbi:MAG: hypothetical protein A2X12_05830 [Bacteroidetes bacterium GWE2_29_8]|nr:MAG: hypothetical protein A2X12_05830 [Bacteroidetes bacterium GWE2_29_8]OFY17626.1 MAG: hypothetical protein A2X02_07845 [Bacteroidetes bacterium GWF2_29_10]